MPHGFGNYSKHRHANVVRGTEPLAMRAIPRLAWLDDNAADLAVGAAYALAAQFKTSSRRTNSDFSSAVVGSCRCTVTRRATYTPT